MKKCNGCGATKQMDEYYKSKRDGHISHCKTCIKAYKVANSDRDSDYQRAHYAKNREQILASRAERPEIRWASSYRERIKKFGFDPVVEDFALADLVALHGSSCVHCGGPFQELDHHPVPVGLGGHHKLSNVRPSCTPCNRQDIWAVRSARQTNRNTTEILDLVVEGLQQQGSPVG